MIRSNLQSEYWRRYRLAAYDMKAGPSPWYQRDYTVQILARDACAAALSNSFRTEATRYNSLDRRTAIP